MRLCLRVTLAPSRAGPARSALAVIHLYREFPAVSVRVTKPQTILDEPGDTGPISSPGSSTSTPFFFNVSSASRSALMLARFSDMWSIVSGCGVPLKNAMIKSSFVSAMASSDRTFPSERSSRSKLRVLLRIADAMLKCQTVPSCIFKFLPFRNASRALLPANDFIVTQIASPRKRRTAELKRLTAFDRCGWKFPDRSVPHSYLSSLRPFGPDQTDAC